jgi:translation initiation factor 1A
MRRFGKKIIQKKGGFNRGAPGNLGPDGQPQQVFRVHLPKGREVFGIIEQRVGSSRMLVKCLDGKTRNCRVPGRFRRRLWLREGDTVLVEPWEFDNEKGDVVFKYSNAEIEWLKRHGYLKDIENEF